MGQARPAQPARATGTLISRSAGISPVASA
jgi:hypothetical protein